MRHRLFGYPSALPLARRWLQVQYAGTTISIKLMNARRVATKLLPGAFGASFGAMIGSLGGLGGWWFFFPEQPLPLFTIVGFLGGSLVGVGIWGVSQSVPSHEPVREHGHTA